MEKNKKAGAQPGNKFGTKLKDPAIRQQAFEQYLQHLSNGWPKQSFHFRNGTHSVCWKTMDRYIEESPDEFPSFLIEEAKSKRYQYWLLEGQKLVQGVYRGGSPVVWQTIMRNIFAREIGWESDSITKHKEPEDNGKLSVLTEFFKQINAKAETPLPSSSPTA